MRAMTRRLVAVVLYVLLLCMQQEGQRHAIDHLRAQLGQNHERALEIVPAPCDECALLAGAAHAVSADAPVHAAVVTPAHRADVTFASAERASLHHYFAQGPPARS
jgi:hypothetical protein